MLKTRDQAGTEQAACSLNQLNQQPARLRDHTPRGKCPREHLHQVGSKARVTARRQCHEPGQRLWAGKIAVRSSDVAAIAGSLSCSSGWHLTVCS